MHFNIHNMKKKIKDIIFVELLFVSKIHGIIYSKFEKWYKI